MSNLTDERLRELCVPTELVDEQCAWHGDGPCVEGNAGCEETERRRLARALLAEREQRERWHQQALKVMAALREALIDLNMGSERGVLDCADVAAYLQAALAEGGDDVD